MFKERCGNKHETITVVSLLFINLVIHCHRLALRIYVFSTPPPTCYHFPCISISFLSITLFFSLSFGGVQFVPTLPIYLYFNCWKIPLPPTTSLSNPFHSRLYISLFILLCPLVCSTPPQPKKSPRKYPAPPVIYQYAQLANSEVWSTHRESGQTNVYA